MAGSDGFWLARGTCTTCGKPAARRVAGPGTHEVTCNVCRAVSRFEAAWRGSPGSPAQAPAARVPVASGKRTALLTAGVVLGLVVIGGLAWALLSGTADDPLTEPYRGHAYTRRLHVERDEAGGATLRVAAAPEADEWPAAVAARGWQVMVAPEPSEEGGAWRECTVASCEVHAPAGSFVLIRDDPMSDPVLFAVDAHKLYRRPLFGDGWLPLPLEGNVLVTLGTEGGALSDVRLGTPGRNVTMHALLLRFDQQGGGSLVVVRLLQGGVPLHVLQMGLMGSFDGRREGSPDAYDIEAGPFVVEVEEEGGRVVRVEGDTSACPSERVLVVVDVVDRSVTLGEPRCA